MPAAGQYYGGGAGAAAACVEAGGEGGGYAVIHTVGTLVVLLQPQQGEALATTADDVEKYYVKKCEGNSIHLNIKLKSISTADYPHDWYKRSSPGGSIGLACDRADKTVLSRFVSGHLRSC
ncbi:hypothetical protein AVEN_236283-1 [Araneus ventricosus]|uniref:Uncharacterized protein n=1 Tax=Araneus ventricosus TaxID=182803 RepID=A0A4Y2USI9_ARAVE|nr:hypothetical protein AVEN_236283-1 [Araneus ventricosus]